jgi:hypothetical protein
MTEKLIQTVKKIDAEENTFALRAAVNEDGELLILYVRIISPTDCRYFIDKYTPEGEFAEQTAADDSCSRAHETMDAQIRLWGFTEENPVLKDNSPLI